MLYIVSINHGKILQYPNVGAPELPSNFSPIWHYSPYIFVDKRVKHWNNWNFKREQSAAGQTRSDWALNTPVIMRLGWLGFSALSQGHVFFSGQETHTWCGGCLTCSGWVGRLIDRVPLAWLTLKFVCCFTHHYKQSVYYVNHIPKEIYFKCDFSKENHSFEIFWLLILKERTSNCLFEWKKV